MGVPEDHGRHIGGTGLQVEAGKVVEDVEQPPGDFHHGGFGQRVRPGTPIHVAADGRHPGDPPERLQHRRVADVAGMDDVGDPRERLHRFRAEHSVRVRDDPDPEASLHPFVPPPLILPADDRELNMLDFRSEMALLDI